MPSALLMQVEDEPDFLSKKDRQKTVHVRVLYQQRVKDKAILTQSRRSPRVLRGHYCDN